MTRSISQAKEPAIRGLLARTGNAGFRSAAVEARERRRLGFGDSAFYLDFNNSVGRAHASVVE